MVICEAPQTMAVGGVAREKRRRDAVLPKSTVGSPSSLIAVGVLLLAAVGQAASAPSPIPTVSGVLAGLTALCLGGVMAFCGAHFALRRA